jgi:hypothetical protein
VVFWVDRGTEHKLVYLNINIIYKARRKGTDKKEYTILVKKPEGKRPLWSPGRKRKGSVKIDAKCGL